MCDSLKLSYNYASQYVLLNIQVGALFSLSCTVTHVAQSAASQLSSQRWRETIARRPKSLAGIFKILNSSTSCLMKLLGSTCRSGTGYILATQSGYKCLHVLEVF